MKSFYFSSLAILLVAVTGSYSFGQTSSYTTSGTYTLNIPNGVTAVGVDMAGGQGGEYQTYGAGGNGGRVQCTLAVTGGTSITINVGGMGGNMSSYTGSGVAGGFNGGGSSGVYYCGAGGGASDIRAGGVRLVIAAGGGGGSDDCSVVGGPGGGTTGGNGSGACTGYVSSEAGAGGSQTAGGAGATNGGGSGAQYTGGNGGYYYGGGGGGGYYGGGGGYYGSGGGGSSWISGPNVSGGTTASGYEPGAGYVNICFPNLGVVSGNIPMCAGMTNQLTPSVTGGTWSSGTPGIATVSSTGLVTAVNAGLATLSYTAVAACGAGSLIVYVLVNPTPNPVVGSASICTGNIETVTTTSTGGAWTSSNTSVASIGTGTGIINALGAGIANISYTSPTTGCAAVLPLTVNSTPFPITGGTSVCANGGTTSLSDGLTGGSWSSSNTANATVTGTGVVTGAASGSTIITYTSIAGCQVTQNLTVNPLPNAIIGTTVVCVNSTTNLSDAGGGSWSTTTPTLAAVGSTTGVVTGIAPGSANVVYTLPTGCSISSPILVNPIPSAITGASSVCAGSSITLSDATPGGIWTSSNSTSATVLPVGGTVTGVAIGTPTISYILGTGCAATLPLVVNPLPVAYTVTGGGGYCTGGSGVHVGLSFGATGINYQLYLGTSLVATVGGSNAGLDFGIQSAVGTYFVTAINTGTSCSGSMAGSTVVSVNPLPAVYNISGGGPMCAGALGQSINLSGTDNMVNYQLLNGSAPIGAPVAGTGSAISIGPETVGGTYTIVATNSVTLCSSNMSGSASITISPSPTVYNVSTGGGYCAGSAGVPVTLNGSDMGITYQLNVGGVPTGHTVSGSGGTLNFGTFTTTGLYTVSATNNTTGCTSTMGGSATITVNPLPNIYNVNGGGSYCSGGTGVHIGLNYSTTGVNYQLYHASTLAGPAVAGTSSGLDFGLQTSPGTYTVVATNQLTGCSQNMSGTVTVTTNPLPVAYSVTGGGSFCAGSAGARLGLSGSSSGVTYQLYNGLLTAGTPVNGTGASLNLGTQTSPGAYTVVATSNATSCTNIMNGTATINVNSLPNVYTVSSSGSNFCAGGNGIDIQLSSSDPSGVSYQLFRGSAAMSAVIPGTGGSVDFNNQTLPGSYTVTATETATGCTATMAGIATVVVNPLPSHYNVTGGGSYCAGGAGVHIGLNNSTMGVNYQLYNSAGSVGTAIAGTGSTIDFGYSSSVDAYGVVATNVITGCTDSMTGMVTVSTNALPASYTVGGGGNYCFGGSGIDINLGGSDNGTSYQLYLGTSPSGTAVIGNGSGVDFGKRSSLGSYTVVATNPVTNCSASMSGSATVGNFPLPPAHNITGGGPYCAGGTGVMVSLDGSENGINYQLYYNGAVDSGETAAGSGSALTFGPFTNAGSYTIVAQSSTTFCQDNMNGAATVSILPQPAAYTVIGGGGYCAGGTGRSVGLSASDTGIKYQLYNTGVAVGSLMSGTSGAISFGLQTIPGTYTIVANPGGICQTNMTGSTAVSVNPLPAPYTVTGGGSNCHGTAGVPVGLSSSDAGVKYQLYNGSLAVGAAMAGTGGAINFGPQTTSGTYSTSALDTITGCSVAKGTSGSVTVSNVALPVIYDVTGGGHYCNGSSGVAVTLAGSSTNVNYQLYFGSTLVGPAMPGTGTVLDFGLQTQAGTYTVVATDAASLCTNNMADTATITIDPVQMPVVSITPHPSLNIVKLQTDTLTANASTAGTNPMYQWSINSFPITGATSQTFVYSKFDNNDIVTCTVTSAGGDCTGYTGTSTVTMHVSSNVGVAQITTGDVNVSVIPNPNKGAFTVTGSLSSNDDQEINIQVVDLLGHVIYNQTSVAKNGTINENVLLNGVANGMYLLNLRSGADSKVCHVVVEQ